MSRQKSDVLRLIRRQPYKIARAVGFNDFKRFPHNDWMRSILFSRKEVLTLQAHRGSYKTTALSVCIALMMVLWPRKTILLIRKTEDDIMTFVSQVKNILQSDSFRWLVEVLYDTEIEFRKQTSFALDTNLSTGISGAYQFDTLSLTGSLTGKHADIVITDDIVTLKDRVSAAERNQTKRQYMELQNVVNRDGRIINTGTPWHKEDAFQLMGEIDRYSIYDTGMIDREQEKRLRQSMSPSLFAANYELKHIADEEQMFGAPNLYEGRVEDIHNGIAHIDAAYGGSDYTAFTILKEHRGKLLVFGKLYEKHVDDVLDEILVFHRLFRAGTIYAEKNADKGYLIKEIKSRGVPARTYAETTNKFIKISTFLRSSWENIYFCEGTDAAYIDQILDYNEFAEHDDAPDSLASLVRLVKKPRRYQ